MNKTLDTRICEVTIYTDKALVMRRGVVQLTGEEHELVIEQLPITLQSESVRVRSTGTAGGQLLGVRTERISASAEIEQKIAHLTQEIGKIEEQKRQGQDLLTLLNHQRNFVKSLSNQYLERMTKFQNPEQMELSQIRELLEFVGQQYSDYSNAIGQQEIEQRQQDKQLQILRQQLQQLSNSQPQESFNLIIAIAGQEAGELELEVSYFVQKVSWTPLYDLRFYATREKINLSYLAEIKQSTGEDWQGVKLTLSTAKPGAGTTPPKVTPWYIDVQNSAHPGRRTSSFSEPVNLPSRAVAAAMPFAGTSPSADALMNSGFDYTFAPVTPPEPSKTGSSVTYAVSGTSHIPSNGLPYKVTIFTEDYPCQADYLSVPRQVNGAYLQATLKNPLTGVTLLPGKVSIFLENTFVGTTELGNIVPSQEFKLNLGIYEGIKIQRDLVERQVEHNRVENQRRTTYAYRLVITNLQECEIKLQVIEQLPISRHEQVQVRLALANPDAESGEMGMLRWLLTVPPLSKQEVYYQFAIEHPHEFTVVGLDI
jgi:uncharacterized protein (TIGR02231 family)